MQKNILHLLIFSFSKSTVLFAPLIAASVLSQSNYGLLEWSLSVSMILSVVLSFGAGAVISFEIIKSEKSKLIDMALFYIGVITFLLGVMGILSFIFFSSLSLNYILAFTGVFLGQFALSAYIKAKGRGAYASMIESFIYIFILLLLFNSIYKELQYLEFLILFSIVSIIFSIILFKLIDNKRTLNKEEISPFFNKGFPIMLSGLLAVGFLNLPRIILGYFGSFEDVAEFSLYFRWAAIAVIAYQFIIVMNFRKIYKLSHVELDTYIVRITFAVLVIGYSLIVTIGALEENASLYSIALPKENLLIQILMIGSITFWTISTSLEGLFYRENLAKYQGFSSLIGISSFLLNIFILNYFIDNIILTFSLSWCLSYMILIITQIFILNKKLDFIFKKVFISLLLIMLLTGIILLFKVVL